MRGRRSTPSAEIDRDLCSRIRASFLLAGPLLARFGRAVMPPPGGDVIGRRRLDPHLDAFAALGAEFEVERDITIQAPTGLTAGEVFMDEPSVMGTENALLAAALTPGTTVIGNAACEPHVQDLARMLVAMGAEISGIGSNVMRVTGASELSGCDHTVGPDHIEVGSFIALAGVTGGEVRISDTRPDDLRMIRLVFAQLGLQTELDGSDVLVPGDQQLIVKRDLGEYKSKIQDGPWPAFPADLTSIAVALATQCAGLGADPRVDVREPAGLHGQADRDGRRHRPLRSAPRDRHRPFAPARRAPVVAGHPRRHVDADRGARRQGQLRDPEHPRDRPRL